jgi:hypothetical protein
MEPASYMRYVVDRNVVMRRIPVLILIPHVTVPYHLTAVTATFLWIG